MKKLINTVRLWLYVTFTKEGRKRRNAFKLIVNLHGLVDDEAANLFLASKKKL